MTPHADLVARLRDAANARRVDVAAVLLTEAADALAALPTPPDPPSTPDAALDEMRRRWHRCAEQSDRYLAQLEALGVVPDDSCRQTPPKSRPADPLYEYCPSCRRLGPRFGLTAIRSEETGGRHCISCFGKTESRLLPLWTAPPADPPALVALVRKWREARRAEQCAARAYDEADRVVVGEVHARHEAFVIAITRHRRAVDELLAYPLPAAPPVTDTPQGDYRALLQQTAAALWDMQHEPDCWCAYSGGSGPTGHTDACAQARVVNEKLKAAGVQHWPAAPPQEDQ